MGEYCPATEENEVVHGGETQVFASPKLQAVFEADVALSLVEAKELVGAKECRQGCESFHDDVATDNNRENQLLEEALDHPWIDRLGAH